MNGEKKKRFGQTKNCTVRLRHVSAVDNEAVHKVQKKIDKSVLHITRPKEYHSSCHCQEVNNRGSNYSNTTIPILIK